MSLSAPRMHLQLAVCIATLHSACVSGPGEPVTRTAIQALHCAHLQSALRTARLSGD